MFVAPFFSGSFDGSPHIFKEIQQVVFLLTVTNIRQIYFYFSVLKMQIIFGIEKLTKTIPHHKMRLDECTGDNEFRERII